MQSRMSELTQRAGQAALDQITASRQAATPRNYALWYSSTSGVNPTLRDTLTAAANERRLSQSELDNLFKRFFGGPVSPQRIAAIASSLIEQTSSAISSLDQAGLSASQRRQTLAGLNHHIGRSADRQELASLVQALSLVAHGMKENCLSLSRKFDESQQEIARLKGEIRALKVETSLDPLTRLANRDRFAKSLAEAIKARSKTGEPLSLLLVDVDLFKSFNDRFGHAVGDQVLRLVAATITEHLNEADLGARFGGDEFAILLRDTSLRQAITVAEKIRHAVIARELMHRSSNENLGRVTISIGAAAFIDGDRPDDLVERADKALYAAKGAGRNRLVQRS
jgi:diguanylate cyclase